MNWVGGARVGAHRLASALLSQQQGVPRADSAPQTKTSMCTHTHTHAACTHHMHTQAHTQTYTKTDTRMHSCKHTQTYPCVHTPIHRHTHIYADWQAHKPTFMQTCAGAQDTHSAGSTTPTSSSTSSTLKGLPCPRVGPHLLILQTSENQAPLGHNHFCFPQKELPPNLWSLRAQRPKTLMVLCWAGLSRDIGGHQVTSLRHLEASFPPNWKMTGHVPVCTTRLRAQGDVPEPSLRRKWGLLLLVMELDRPERNRMTWRSSGDSGQVGSVHPICCC